MALYFITGISGSGKSTTLSELRRRGYEAYDVDEAGPVTAKWHNNKTGYIHPKSSVKQKDRTPEFLANHSWKVPRQEVEDLAKRANDKTIFLGGSVDNKEEIKDLFSKVFALVASNAIVKHRILARSNNDFGKLPHELATILKWNRYHERQYRQSGALIVDSSQPISKVADEILSYINES